MTYGISTTKIARILREQFGPQGLDVLCGHREGAEDPPDNLGKINSWFGSVYGSDVMLADLDIAIVVRHTNRVIALIEIEERPSVPKKLIGDILATLLGSHITFQGKRELWVGKWTNLIVLTIVPNVRSQKRNDFIQKQVNILKTCLDTPNAKIGRIILDTFQRELELEQKLNNYVQAAIAMNP